MQLQQANVVLVTHDCLLCVPEFEKHLRNAPQWDDPDPELATKQLAGLRWNDVGGIAFYWDGETLAAWLDYENFEGWVADAYKV